MGGFVIGGEPDPQNFARKPTKISDPHTQLAKKEGTLRSLKTQHRLNKILGLKKM